MRIVIMLAAAAAMAMAQDWQDPAYWGLKKGAYIPRPGCWGGNFTKSRNHNRFDYEICTSVTYLQEGE